MRLLLSILAFFAVLHVSAQNPKPLRIVPDTINKAFQKLFKKGVHELKWMQDNRRYRATFRMKTSGHSIVFNPDGTIYKWYSDIEIADLPEDVRDMSLKYGTIRHAWKLFTASENTEGQLIKYEIQAGDYMLKFDDFGRLVSELPVTK